MVVVGNEILYNYIYLYILEINAWTSIRSMNPQTNVAWSVLTDRPSILPGSSPCNLHWAWGHLLIPELRINQLHLLLDIPQFFLATGTILRTKLTASRCVCFFFEQHTSVSKQVCAIRTQITTGVELYYDSIVCWNILHNCYIRTYLCKRGWQVDTHHTATLSQGVGNIF